MGYTASGSPFSLVVRQQATSYSVVLNDANNANSAHDSHDTDYLVQHCTLYGNAMHWKTGESPEKSNKASPYCEKSELWGKAKKAQSTYIKI